MLYSFNKLAVGSWQLAKSSWQALRQKH